MAKFLLLWFFLLSLACRTTKSSTPEATPQASPSPKPNTTAQKQCLDKGLIFESISGTCITPMNFCKNLNDGSKWDAVNNICMSPKAICLKAKNIWVSNSCTTPIALCQSNGGVWKNNDCLTPQDACLKQGVRYKWVAASKGLGQCSSKTFMDYCRDPNPPRPIKQTLMFLHLAAGTSDQSCQKTYDYLKAAATLTIDGNQAISIFNQVYHTQLTEEDYLSELGPISEFKFESLVLPNNKIRDVSPLGGNLKLKTLDLQGNLVDSVAGLYNSLFLEELFLGYNRVSNLEGIQFLVKLTDLHLFDNGVTDISLLRPLHNMKHLYLKGNFIKSLESIVDMGDLEVLDVDLNPIAQSGFLKLESNCPVSKGPTILRDFCSGKVTY
mgnify:CR=1 FL=1